MSNIYHPYLGMKRYVASSAAFQAAVGAASATLALNHVFSNPVGYFSVARAIVRMDSGITRSNFAIGNWRSTGSIYICLERKYDVIASEDPIEIDAQEESFSSWCSTVMREVEVLVDARQAVMGFNPLAVSSIRAEGNAYCSMAEESQLMDPHDVETPTAAIGKSIWCMEFVADLY